MRIEADLFLTFYEILLSKFIETEYKIQRNDQWVEEEIWNRNNACEEKFDVSGYNYFYRKKVSVLKDKPQTIPIAPGTLIKALKYIGFEIVNEKEALSGLVLKPKENAHAALVWEQFKTTHPEPSRAGNVVSNSVADNKQAPKTISKKSASADFEKSFLDIISQNTDVFNPTEIKNIFSTFFHLIQSKKYYDAWIMLSPEFQRKSLWNGSPANFEYSYSYIESLSIYEIKDFSYHAKKILFTVDYGEVGNLVDMRPILKDIRDEQMTNLMNRFYIGNVIESFRKILEKFFSDAENFNRYNWIGQKGNNGLFNQRIYPKTTPGEFFDLIDKNWKSLDFQKAFLVALKNPFYNGLAPYFQDKLLKYSESCRASVICVYQHERWLIDSLSIEENVWLPGVF